MWNISEKLSDTPYFSRRNRDLGTISVYVWGMVTSAVYHPYMYICRKYNIVSAINTPTPEGVIISQPKTSFLGVVFDVDHDFEGPREPHSSS